MDSTNTTSRQFIGSVRAWGTGRGGRKVETSVRTIERGADLYLHASDLFSLFVAAGDLEAADIIGRAQRAMREGEA